MHTENSRKNADERYGNEEDPQSRDARRIYHDQNLEQRLHDDSPYNRPGYEPEVGSPGGRQHVDLSADGPRLSTQSQASQPVDAPDDDAAQPATPYDEGDVGAWYGGDTGMGDSGSSLVPSPDSERVGAGS